MGRDNKILEFHQRSLQPSTAASERSTTSSRPMLACTSLPTTTWRFTSSKILWMVKRLCSLQRWLKLSIFHSKLNPHFLTWTNVSKVPKFITNHFSYFLKVWWTRCQGDFILHQREPSARICILPRAKDWVAQDTKVVDMQYCSISSWRNLQQMGPNPGRGKARESCRQEGSYDKYGSINCKNLQAIDSS